MSMTRRSGFWRLAAGLYFAINFFGAAYAIRMGEMPHAAAHVALLLVGIAGWSRWAATRDARAARLGSTSGQAPAGDLTDRFRNLEQSIDAVAIEVERISEGQRQMTNLLVDRDAPPAPGIGAPPSANLDRDRSSS